MAAKLVLAVSWEFSQAPRAGGPQFPFYLGLFTGFLSFLSLSKSKLICITKQVYIGLRYCSKNHFHHSQDLPRIKARKPTLHLSREEGRSHFTRSTCGGRGNNAAIIVEKRIFHSIQFS
jgi:hypothetical protein